ncbi:hypothetical protein D6783_02030 [Candidatus Woesearchaeota archaeon]|nr:MAG: hypothetical protein D6783_02030 [Candidatus Woesearchaeota archaeon]
MKLSMQFIKTIKQLAVTDEALIGRKLTALVKLQEQHMALPLGFAILNNAFSSFIDQNDLRPKLSALLSAAKGASEDRLVSTYHSVREFFLTSRFPDLLFDEILEAVDSLVMDESASLYEMMSQDREPNVTMMLSLSWDQGNLNEGIVQNIQGKEEIATALKECWASAFSPKLLSRAAGEGLPQVGVFVFRMQPASATAIARSSPDSDIIFVQAYAGHPDVAERTQGDEFSVKKDSLQITQGTVRVQPAKLVVTGNQFERVSLGVHGEKQKINDKQVVEVARLAKRAEMALEGPVRLWVFFRNEDPVVFQVQTVDAQEGSSAEQQKASGVPEVHSLGEENEAASGASLKAEGVREFRQEGSTPEGELKKEEAERESREGLDGEGREGIREDHRSASGGAAAASAEASEPVLDEPKALPAEAPEAIPSLPVDEDLTAPPNVSTQEYAGAAKQQVEPEEDREEEEVGRDRLTVSEDGRAGDEERQVEENETINEENAGAEEDMVEEEVVDDVEEEDKDKEDFAEEEQDEDVDDIDDEDAEVDDEDEDDGEEGVDEDGEEDEREEEQDEDDKELSEEDADEDVDEFDDEDDDEVDGDDVHDAEEDLASEEGEDEDQEREEFILSGSAQEDAPDASKEVEEQELVDESKQRSRSFSESEEADEEQEEGKNEDGEDTVEQTRAALAHVLETVDVAAKKKFLRARQQTPPEQFSLLIDGLAEFLSEDVRQMLKEAHLVVHGGQSPPGLARTLELVKTCSLALASLL